MVVPNDIGTKPRMVICIDDDIHIEEIDANATSPDSLTMNGKISEHDSIEEPIVIATSLASDDSDDQLSKSNLDEKSDSDADVFPSNDFGKDQPKREPKPWTRNDLERISTHLATCIDTSDGFRDKATRLIPLCADNQLPKGMRTIIHHFSNLSDTAAATKALVDYYLETDDEQRFASIKESKLSMTTNIIGKMLENHGQRLQEGLDELEEMIKNGEERIVLNQKTRNIKKKTSLLNNYAEQQAHAFSKAIESYNPDQDPLPILERFAACNDKKIMTCIDNTLNLAGTSMVLVEDAPKMIEALEHNDTKAIIELQKKMIDNLFDKE